MYRKKLSSKQLNGLWKNTSSLKISHGSKSSYIKKSMDDICFQAELAETSWDYAHVICKGMQRLLKMGVPAQIIINHQNLLQKLLYLGRDIMQTSQKTSDMFCIGVLIELKIYSKWKQIEFYEFLLNALKMIKEQKSFVTARLKDKLFNKLKVYNKSLFTEFIEEQSSA